LVVVVRVVEMAADLLEVEAAHADDLRVRVLGACPRKARHQRDSLFKFDSEERATWS